MLRKQFIYPLLAIIGLLLLVVWLAGGFADKLAPGEKPLPSAYQGQTYVVEKAPLQVIEQLPASVVAKQNTLVSSRLLAELKTLNVRAGDQVQAGQLLATLDDAELKAQLQRVAAEQAANTAKLTQAKKQLARSKALNEQGLVAINQVDEWQARVNELTAQGQALSEAYRSAEVALGYTQIVAPISGKVVERLKEPGSLLSPGTAIVSLLNPLQLQVQVAVRESQITAVNLGQQFTVHIPALNITQPAKVTEMHPLANSQARNFMIKLDMALMPKVIPGMYALVDLPLNEQSAITIPSQYILRQGQLAMVKVVAQGKIHKRYVRVGETRDNRTHIISGLEAGETLAL
ncbi:efflux RND transporter periplasmic adaptor subunit [Pseudoalteromonas 'SMAR']|uniref:efflux RND transporter periplasmic adaptor subunit n=1 Tax=Pseudoalteromonas 'SMAR' TaxID=3416908 RepID=UPI003AF252E0